MSIKVSIKQVYGNTLIYPECDKAKVFSKLVKQKTLTTSDIALIKALGFTVEVVQESITL